MGFINEYHRKHYEACIKEFAEYSEEQLAPENLMRNALRIRRESQAGKVAREPRGESGLGPH